MRKFLVGVFEKVKDKSFHLIAVFCKTILSSLGKRNDRSKCRCSTWIFRDSEKNEKLVSCE